MKYLVTGATGYLGSHLARALEGAGHAVVPFARSLGGDVLDGPAVARAAAGCDGVFHCAGRVSRRPTDAEEMYRVHVRGTKAVLASCVEARVRRVVVASTSGTIAVTEDPHHVCNEDGPPPIGLVSRWPYYRAKLFAERSALSFHASGRLEVVCANPSLLLGPGDANGSSTEDVRLFLQGGLRVLPAGGLSFVDVRDAAEGLLAAMTRGRSGERYLLGAANMTFAEFFGRLGRIAGVRTPRLEFPRSPDLARWSATWVERMAGRLGVASAVDPTSAEMSQYFWYVDAAKAMSELGWTPRDPLSTLFDTIEDLRARGLVWSREDSTAAASAPKSAGSSEARERLGTPSAQ
ncbi:MAG TPA: NAD-dependent epimerase/dehydratase family protein [Polyangiaceae bacterium]|nr:NAD-dependent epimerase/dehydratase family protein [Polyangiaceae bacterium]